MKRSNSWIFLLILAVVVICVGTIQLTEPAYAIPTCENRCTYSWSTCPLNCLCAATGTVKKCQDCPGNWEHCL